MGHWVPIFQRSVALKFLLCPARLRTFHPTHLINSQATDKSAVHRTQVRKLSSIKSGFPSGGAGESDESRPTVSLRG